MKFLRIIGFFTTAVVVICAASVGLVYANNRALHLTSNDAELVADTYSVGTAFAGSVQDMLVERGSQVVAGQELFRLQSATLDQALQTQRFSSEGVGYRVEGNDVIVFTAVKDGTVQELNASIGSFVPGNTVIALVGISDSLHLEATFSMSARDYARLPVGGSVSVDMPDGTTETTTIYELATNHLSEQVWVTPAHRLPRNCNSTMRKVSATGLLDRWASSLCQAGSHRETSQRCIPNCTTGRRNRR
jgi:hypothetical protein